MASFRKLRYQPHYVGGDIIKRRNSNCILDITSINFKDNYFDLLICNHVLEHVVQDTLAMKECYRVMKKGQLVFSQFQYLVIKKHGHHH